MSDIDAKKDFDGYAKVKPEDWEEYKEYYQYDMIDDIPHFKFKYIVLSPYEKCYELLLKENKKNFKNNKNNKNKKRQ